MCVIAALPDGRRRIIDLWSRIINTSQSHGFSHVHDDDVGQHQVEVEIETRAPFMLALQSMLLSSWWNTLLVFVPIGTLSYLSKISPVLTFATNMVAIVPLSAMLTNATERIATDSGDTIGALINISLGNLVELILL